ncbi:MAG: hypothetical protein A2521_04435 [Deltaproteobacteria bacterium RIFOXYD12_FULL_57_12]|nr:MAG: hypothetical protein A2521_04435 [Deltaproteobacteria bacterium RIFOXYD12_FULL_57_12]
MGLRLGEGIRLTVGDIDAGNMRVHIRVDEGTRGTLVLKQLVLDGDHSPAIPPTKQHSHLGHK